MKPNSALIVVDFQRDFCEGGSLAVAGANALVPSVNRMLKHAGDRHLSIYATRDWHPIDTPHFETWPVHCVKMTPGAQFHPDLKLPHGWAKFHIENKGEGDEDQYSGFDAKLAPEEKTLYVCGLATDYCVKATVLDAIARGHEVFVLIDAIAAVNNKPEDGREALDAMAAAGATVITVDAAIAHA